MADRKTLTEQMMRDPAVMAALQAKMQEMVGKSSGLIESYPPDVQARIKALKNFNKEHHALELQFNKEVAELEKKYQKLYAPIYAKRTEIVGGGREPTEAEATYEDSEEEEEDEEIAEVQKKMKEELKLKNANAAPVQGIPDFWLTAMQNHEAIQALIQEHDVPILSSLKDVRLVYLEGEQQGFTLEFEFDANEYFSNTVLTKTYFVDENDEYCKLEGCAIQWNGDKDVTVQKTKKKQRHKSSGQVRTTTKIEPRESFFRFFAPPQIPDDDAEEELDEEAQQQLSLDIEAGEALKEEIIPHAVLWFTGEANDDYEPDDDEYDDDEEYEEDEDEDDDDDEDEEKDPNFDPTKKPETPAECKQQ